MTRPNILLAISDDQAWPYAGAYGCKIVNTPAFDRIASTGILMNHAHCPAPQCGPSRASLLTGRNIWQNEEAGTHASVFPKWLQVYPDLLEDAGYEVGYTGKGWVPGDYVYAGRSRNPAGTEYQTYKCEPPTNCINANDYARNFEDFLSHVDEDQPFCFWYGAREPHRSYEKGSGVRAGKRLEDVEVPQFLPDNDTVRSDILDYAYEIDWFDHHLDRMLKLLEERGQLENTLVVVTSDNGMPFPRAKANTYEHGAHVPMAISWPKQIPGGRIVDDFCSFVDLGPTFLDAAGVEVPEAMTGTSLMDTLTSPDSGLVDASRTFTVTGRERHTHARVDNLGYPIRTLHTEDFVYIRNLSPDLWPMGELLYDVDDGPTKSYYVEHKDEADVTPFYDMAFGKRPLEELFDRRNDPYCMNNIADDPVFKDVKEQLWAQLEAILREQNDPRILGFGDIFDSYPRIIHMRPGLAGFAEQRRYNLEYAAKARAAMEELGYPEEEIAAMCDKPAEI